MAGFRKYNDPAETTTKLTLLVPIEIDRQLRALAAGQGIGVGPTIRGWLVENLRKTKDIKDVA